MCPIDLNNMIKSGRQKMMNQIVALAEMDEYRFLRNMSNLGFYRCSHSFCKKLIRKEESCQDYFGNIFCQQCYDIFIKTKTKTK